MEAQLSRIEGLVKSIKESMFSADIDPFSLITPSAYDTAWLAMIPDNSHQPLKPMFNICLYWLLHNQHQLGFWGDQDRQGNPTIECLISTLASIVALRKWNVGSELVNKGMAYIYSAESEKILKEMKDCYPVWFAIVFPGMVELAAEVAHLNIKLELSDIFHRRQQIPQTTSVVQLMSHLEALPCWYSIDEDVINSYVANDGSFFQSPSATARAFMTTRNSKCLLYLHSLVQRFSDKGVPTTYPVSEEHIKLCAINHVERLGLSQHFVLEKEHVLEEAYKNYTTMNKSEITKPSNSDVASIQQKLLNDSLAFRLLRMHGYQVFPWNVCWFLYDEEIKTLIENNHEYFTCAMLNIYRATDVMFPAELELEEAREFSKKLVQKSILIGAGSKDGDFPHKLIENELRLPWMARLEHLEHRLWIEDYQTNALWFGKTSLLRFSKLHNDKLDDLAVHNYQFKQFIFKNELEELKRWSKEHGLDDVGFAREKTAYCYFAVAASCSSLLPYHSHVRMIAAKSGVIITIADDFFDMKDSNLYDLRTLTNAVRRWDGKYLRGNSKIIFDALDNLVSEMAMNYLKEEGRDITCYLRDIWCRTFCSWLTESEWGMNRSKPSMDEYIRVAMVSIAIHTIVLPASCFLKPRLPHCKTTSTQYDRITKLIMIIARLLNDIQSYKKEKEAGNVNSVLLYLESNPEVDVEEAISWARDILNEKKEELLEYVFRDGLSADLSRESRLLHFNCLQVFQMFFNSSNRYDSDTEMLEDISKAIYVPLKVCAKRVLSLPSESKITKHLITKCSAMKYYHDFRRPKTFFMNKSFLNHKLSKPTCGVGNWKMSNLDPKVVKFRPA